MHEEVKNQVVFQFQRRSRRNTMWLHCVTVGAVVKMPLSWHALAKCGRLQQRSPYLSQDHWQVPWISLSIRWIEVRRCAERPCCDLQGERVCSVAAVRVVQDVVIGGVFPVLADEHLVQFLRVSTFHCRSLSTLQSCVKRCTVYKLKGRMRIAMIGLLWFGVE